MSFNNTEPILTTLKLLIIGDSGVGKSSILMRFIDDNYPIRQAATIGVDYKVKIMSLAENGKVKLSIWDTAGQERFRTLTPSYYRGAHGVIFVYDVENFNSYANINKWMTELDRYATKVNLIKMLVGNKIDMDKRVVSREEGLRLARKHRMLYSETSAKTSEGVRVVFHELVDKILQEPELWTPEMPESSEPEYDEYCCGGVSAAGGGGGDADSQCSASSSHSHTHSHTHTHTHTSNAAAFAAALKQQKFRLSRDDSLSFRSDQQRRIQSGSSANKKAAGNDCAC